MKKHTKKIFELFTKELNDLCEMHHIRMFTGENDCGTPRMYFSSIKFEKGEKLYKVTKEDSLYCLKEDRWYL